MDAQRNVIIQVPQRDLFSKYKWPARPTIIQKLKQYKEEVGA